MRWEGAPETDCFRQATGATSTSSPRGPSTAPAARATIGPDRSTASSAGSRRSRAA
jgi:hypothetical protein